MVFRYKCDSTLLSEELRKTFFLSSPTRENKEFYRRKVSFYEFKFFLFILFRICHIPHYHTAGLLGYETFLFDEKYAWKLLSSKRKTLLDIGAGSGSITKMFEPHVTTIYFREPASSFANILKKRGYRESEWKNKYDIITLFNVLDICREPERLLQESINMLAKDGVIIISLPFPIWTRSWDIKNIRNTNHLGQSGMLSFEESVGDFYENCLKKHGLEVTKFTRLPYLVSKPDTRDVIIYDSGLFVCTI